MVTIANFTMAAAVNSIVTKANFMMAAARTSMVTIANFEIQNLICLCSE